MAPAVDKPYEGETALLATMHGKERVIGPVLARSLGLRVQVPVGLDTDRFGTFSREVARPGSQLDAARAKIEAAFASAPAVRIALASEGSFGPHPQLPFIPFAREIVVFKDRATGLEIVGHHADSQTNYGHRIVTTVEAGCAFAQEIGFPVHGVIVMGARAGQPDPTIRLAKQIAARIDLERALQAAIDACGAAFVEADMRAHRNPTRMRAIERAAEDLVQRFRCPCPACGRPDFHVTERIPGLPCADCGNPTHVIEREASVCVACGHRLERPAADRATADPSQCDVCNP